jgi:hypothetical protein
MELGIYTFADMTPDKVSGKAINAHKRVQQLLEEIQLADQVGLTSSLSVNIIGPITQFPLLR